MSMINNVGFGGGCHWCTEAVFDSLIGVKRVDQGWINSSEAIDFSEAVWVHYDPAVIDLQTLATIHLHTHSSTSNHALRGKYRSAIYTFSKDQIQILKATIEKVQLDFDKPIITKILPFGAYKGNLPKYKKYYINHAGNAFCEAYINPKLKLLYQKFRKHLKSDAALSL